MRCAEKALSGECGVGGEWRAGANSGRALCSGGQSAPARTTARRPASLRPSSAALHHLRSRAISTKSFTRSILPSLTNPFRRDSSCRNIQTVPKSFCARATCEPINLDYPGVLVNVLRIHVAPGSIAPSLRLILLKVTREGKHSQFSFIIYIKALLM